MYISRPPTRFWEYRGQKRIGCHGELIPRKTSLAKYDFRKSGGGTCAYQGVRNVCFSEILVCFPFLKHPFLRFALFALLPTNCRLQYLFTDQTFYW